MFSKVALKIAVNSAHVTIGSRQDRFFQTKKVLGATCQKEKIKWFFQPHTLRRYGSDLSGSYALIRWCALFGVVVTQWSISTVYSFAYVVCLRATKHTNISALLRVFLSLGSSFLCTPRDHAAPLKAFSLFFILWKKEEERKKVVQQLMWQRRVQASSTTTMHDFILACMRASCAGLDDPRCGFQWDCVQTEREQCGTLQNLWL